MQYAGYNVDERFSAIVEPNLYYDSIFQPGMTFSDKFQGDGVAAGLVHVYKLTGDAVAAPKTPASDFTHEAAANSLLDVRLNNTQSKSKKIYRVQSIAVPYDMAESHLAEAVTNCREGWQASGLACLVHEGTVLEDTDALTKANLKTKILSARKAVRKGKAVANVVLASVDTYTLMLEAAGDQYTPVTNDAIMQSGQIGRWLGMLWVECNMLDLMAAAKYYDYAGVLQTKDLTAVDFIMYDWNRFSVVDNLETIRLKDSENFNGTLAQVEINSGYRVTEAGAVAVKTHGATGVTGATGATGETGN